MVKWIGSYDGRFGAWFRGNGGERWGIVIARRSGGGGSSSRRCWARTTSGRWTGPGRRSGGGSRRSGVARPKRGEDRRNGTRDPEDAGGPAVHREDGAGGVRGPPRGAGLRCREPVRRGP